MILILNKYNIYENNIKYQKLEFMLRNAYLFYFILSII